MKSNLQCRDCKSIVKKGDKHYCKEIWITVKPDRNACEYIRTTKGER